MKTYKTFITLGIVGLVYVPTSLALLYFQTYREMRYLGAEEWTMNYFTEHISFIRIALIPVVSLICLVAGLLLNKKSGPTGSSNASQTIQPI